jgi:hypothetical protein
MLWIKQVMWQNDLEFIKSLNRFWTTLQNFENIHHAQGLMLDCLLFDPIGVTKHGFTYTVLFHIHYKEPLYLLSPPLNKNFYVNPIVE